MGGDLGRRSRSRRAFLQDSGKFVALGTLTLVLGHRGQPVTAAAKPEIDAIIDECGLLVQQRMRELAVPGAAIGVVADGQTRAAGFGVTNVDHPLPVDTDTLFQIGSTTKTFTGTAIARLIEREFLDLDAPVRRYLPQFSVADRVVSRDVTLRHLVTHTAGWLGDVEPETGDGNDALTLAVAAMADLPQIAPLGRFYGYNNAAVAVAGRVIEAVAQKSYEDAIDELILQPLALTHTAFFAEEIMTESVAVGHDSPDGMPLVVKPWALPRSVNPSGGLVSSISDQLRYARFHMGDGDWEGQQLLSPAMLRRMQSKLGPGGSDGPYLLDGVGINWLLRSVNGVKVVGHGGSTNGQQSAFALVPSRGFAMVVLTNANSGEALANEVVAWSLERFLGLTEPVFEVAPLGDDELGDYEGEFALPDGSGGRVRATAEGLAMDIVLRGEPFGQVSLVPAGRDQFAVVDGNRVVDRVDFERDDNGQVGWVRAFARLVPRIA